MYGSADADRGVWWCTREDGVSMGGVQGGVSLGVYRVVYPRVYPWVYPWVVNLSF